MCDNQACSQDFTLGAKKLRRGALFS